MTSPRERAARRLYEAEPLFYHPAHPPFKTGEIPWDAPDAEPWRDRYFRIVDAVLDEIREPGERLGAFMLKCRIDIERGAVPLGGDEVAGNPSRWLLPVWRKAIDAIKRGEG